MQIFCIVFVFISSGTGASIYSSYRKDFFYPYDEYREANLPDPVNGGRFHIVTLANGTGSLQTVTINGKEVQFESGQNSDDWFVDWMHVYPSRMEQGKPVWISFHTRDQSFNKQPNTASIKVTTATGQTAIDGKFLVQLTSCNITYITVDKSHSVLLIHVHNGYPSDTRTIKAVIVNGTDVTKGVSNPSSLSIAPETSTLLSISLAKRQLPGNLVTVVLEFSESGSVPIGTGVRLAKTHFPIEAWPKSHECPYPTINDSNYQFHRDHGIDTFFFGQGVANPCGKSAPLGSEVASKLAPQYGFYCLIGTDIPSNELSNYSNILARFLGDEADIHLNDGLRDLMKTAESVWKNESSLLTYVGGSRSRRSGIFSGVTDIQGMDMYINNHIMDKQRSICFYHESLIFFVINRYVAACAPHIQEFFHPPPLRGSYDYMRLTRNNHMPLSTWLYSQLLDDGWDAKIGELIISHREPNPDEARIQAMSVIAGCAKGIMYFQSEVSEEKYYPETWKEIGKFNKDIGAVREYLREGDCTDMVKSSDGDSSSSGAESISQAIRSRNAIIVPVINLKNDGGISDIKCEAGGNEHWKISNHTVQSIEVYIPSDFGEIIDTFEVRDGQISDIPNISYEDMVLGIDYHGNKLMGGSTSIKNVDLSSSKSTRLFVLANDKNVRKDIQNNFGHL